MKIVCGYETAGRRRWFVSTKFQHTGTLAAISSTYIKSKPTNDQCFFFKAGTTSPFRISKKIPDTELFQPQLLRVALPRTDARLLQYALPMPDTQRLSLSERSLQNSQMPPHTEDHRVEVPMVSAFASIKLPQQESGADAGPPAAKRSVSETAEPPERDDGRYCKCNDGRHCKCLRETMKDSSRSRCSTDHETNETDPPVKNLYSCCPFPPAKNDLQKQSPPTTPQRKYYLPNRHSLARASTLRLLRDSLPKTNHTPKNPPSRRFQTWINAAFTRWRRRTSPAHAPNAGEVQFFAVKLRRFFLARKWLRQRQNNNFRRATTKRAVFKKCFLSRVRPSPICSCHC